MVLIDTHVILWWQSGDRHLSATARRAIARAARVLVSPISCWEIATLVRLRRIELRPGVFDWIREILVDERVDMAPLTPTAAASAGLLGSAFTGDIADRLLYATARELAIPLVTKDQEIRSFARTAGDVRTIW